MAAIRTISTKAGRVRIYEKSLKYDYSGGNLFFGTGIRITDLPENFLVNFANILSRAYDRGREDKSAEIKAAWAAVKEKIE